MSMLPPRDSASPHARRRKPLGSIEEAGNIRRLFDRRADRAFVAGFLAVLRSRQKATNMVGGSNYCPQRPSRQGHFGEARRGAL
jgi:hypothetical protein